jgi:hypothetical protein
VLPTTTVIKLKQINTVEEFNAIAHLSDHNKKRVLPFPNCQFNFEIMITDELSSVDFDNCTFKENATFSSIFVENASFSRATFEKEVKFDNSRFKGKVRFHGTEFKGKVSFNNTKFEDLVDFWATTFNQPTIFQKTDFLGMTVFAATTFLGNVLFTYALIEKVIIFRSTKFLAGLDLSLALQQGSLSIFDISLQDYPTVADPETEADYENLVSHEAIIPERNKRETFRILKKELQSQGNSFDALTFSALETKAFTRQLESKLRKAWSAKDIEDYFLVGLNNLSNRHGNSWLRGVAFTMIVGYLFYYLSLLSTAKYHFGFSEVNSNDVEECFKYFVAFLIPTHNIDYMSGLGQSGWSFVWDFVGRTFVAYGIYQTIQAFRRFRKA